MKAMETQPYTVLVDDNFHFMDENERWLAGTFDNLPSAVDKCIAIVKASLLEDNYPAMSAEDLYATYTSGGDDPFIRGPINLLFSAWDYAKALAAELAGQSREAGPVIAAIFSRGYRAAYLSANAKAAR